MRTLRRLLSAVSLFSAVLLSLVPLVAQTQRVVRVPTPGGKLSVLQLTRAMLDEYGFAGEAVDFHDVHVDIRGPHGRFLLMGISKSLGDTTRLRRSRDGSEVVITVDRMRARMMRQKMKDRFGKAVSVLAGRDVLARRYTLELPKGLDRTGTFVLCIHGMDSSGRAFDDLREELGRGDDPIRSGTFTYANDEAIDRIAEELSKRLKRQAKAFPQRRIILVAHSMGGLVARYVLENPALDPGNVDTLILLGVPNHGSQLARLRSVVELLEFLGEEGNRGDVFERLLDGMGEAGWDLRPDSPFLAALNERPRNPNVRYHLLLGDRGMMDQDKLDEYRAKVLRQVHGLQKSEIYEPKIAAWLNDLDEVVHGKGDGAVTVARGRLQGVQEVVLPVTHTGMLQKAGDGGEQPVFAQVRLWIAGSRKPK